MMKWLISVLLSLSFSMPWAYAEMPPEPDKAALEISHQHFRNDVIRYVKSIAKAETDNAIKTDLNELEQQWNNHYQQTRWQIGIQIYHDGKPLNAAQAEGGSLSQTLKQATQTALAGKELGANDEVEDYRFIVTFYYHPYQRYEFIDSGVQGLELQSNRVIVRSLSQTAIEEQITASKAYLLRNMNSDFSGFSKFYDAANDESEQLLRTTYSATALYTFIRLNQHKKDLELESYFKDIASFLLDRQLKEGPNAGGFDYGIDPETGKDTCRVVVGTTSKTVFTLLLLHELYPNDEQYLNSATAAGNWLLSTIKEDGNVTPIAECKQDGWKYDDKQSFLYTGQVVSALSRLYQVTQNPDYLSGAKKVASLLLQEVALQGALVADEYRPANSISSSWILMALIDLEKVNPTPVYEKTVLQLADMLVERQIDTPYDAFNHGRYLDVMTTGGNGWINEVMGEMVKFCQANDLTNCDDYRQAIYNSSRWLLQNAYTPLNTYNVKNPEQAMGGFITSFNTQTVRTDAVCHGLNGLLTLLEIENSNSTDATLLTLPQRPLKEIIPLLRVGDSD